MAAGVNGSCRLPLRRRPRLPHRRTHRRWRRATGAERRQGGEERGRVPAAPGAGRRSCGRLGILAELTFKVFPAAEAHATLRVTTADLPATVTLVASLQRARFDLEAIDIAPPTSIWIRLGGFREHAGPRESMPWNVRSEERAEVSTGEHDAAIWRHAREFAWAPASTPLVRVPITLPMAARLDAALERYEAARRYTVAGNLALIAWNGALDSLSDAPAGSGAHGPGPRRSALVSRFIGAAAPNAVEERLAGRDGPRRAVRTLTPRRPIGHPRTHDPYLCSITSRRIRRPPTREAMARAVETCVHCGFCLPACPTYRVLGEEMDSPRGRIVLMKEVLEGDLALEDALPHIDRCLGCLGCVSACPSGVKYRRAARAVSCAGRARRRVPANRAAAPEPPAPHAGVARASSG